MNQTCETSMSLKTNELRAYVQDSEVTETAKKYYPLKKWQPNEFGEMDLTIKANGEWWHEGTKMTKQSLVTFFSNLLWLEEENQTKSYYLKTPVEQLQITVEDVPLLITDVNLIPAQLAVAQRSKEQAIKSKDSTNKIDNDDRVDDGDHIIEFITQTADKVYLDNDNMIYFANYQGNIRPYIHVRDNLHALISRTVFYHLLEIGTVHEQEDDTFLSLSSGGKVFDILFVE